MDVLACLLTCLPLYCERFGYVDKVSLRAAQHVGEERKVGLSRLLGGDFSFCSRCWFLGAGCVFCFFDLI